MPALMNSTAAIAKRNYEVPDVTPFASAFSWSRRIKSHFSPLAMLVLLHPEVSFPFSLWLKFYTADLNSICGLKFYLTKENSYKPFFSQNDIFRMTKQNIL